MTNTYIRHCKKCEEIFKPTGKYNFVCDKCKKIQTDSRKKVKPEPHSKINTTITCPKCGEKIDFSGIKQAVKSRLDQELDYILDKI